MGGFTYPGWAGPVHVRVTNIPLNDVTISFGAGAPPASESDR